MIPTTIRTHVRDEHFVEIDRLLGESDVSRWGRLVNIELPRERGRRGPARRAAAG